MYGSRPETLFPIIANALDLDVDVNGQVWLAQRQLKSDGATHYYLEWCSFSGWNEPDEDAHDIFEFVRDKYQRGHGPKFAKLELVCL
jgi:hypothetical protein